MGVKEEIEEALQVKPVTKIHSQPSNQGVTKLIQELNKIAASIPSSLQKGSMAIWVF